MWKNLLGLMLCVLPLALQAQTDTVPQPQPQPVTPVEIQVQSAAAPRFGYLNYTQVLKEMPQYAEAESNLDVLQGKYDAEIDRAEAEFTRKYAEFLQEQHEFPENILVKRHKELQELMEKSIAFKEEIRRTLKEARDKMLAPLTAELDKAIAEVAARHNFDYVLNTEDKAYLYINAVVGLDISNEVRSLVGIKPVPREEVSTEMLSANDR